MLLEVITSESEWKNRPVRKFRTLENFDPSQTKSAFQSPQELVIKSLVKEMKTHIIQQAHDTPHPPNKLC
jgi:hypothetical protein